MSVVGLVAEDCLIGVRVVCRREEGLGEEERFYQEVSWAEAATSSLLFG